MIRRPPRSTLDRSSAASDVYKRQEVVLAREDGARRDVRTHRQAKRNGALDGAVVHHLSLIHISEPHETVLDLVCRLLLEKKNNRHT